MIRNFLGKLLLQNQALLKFGSLGEILLAFPLSFAIDGFIYVLLPLMVFVAGHDLRAPVRCLFYELPQLFLVFMFLLYDSFWLKRVNRVGFQLRPNKIGIFLLLLIAPPPPFTNDGADESGVVSMTDIELGVVPRVVVDLGYGSLVERYLPYHVFVVHDFD
jgi:hypothetical protein